MSKYPRTKDGMAKRRNAANASLNKQFNPANGEPHTAKFLDEQRKIGFRRRR